MKGTRAVGPPHAGADAVHGAGCELHYEECLYSILSNYIQLVFFCKWFFDISLVELSNGKVTKEVGFVLIYLYFFLLKIHFLRKKKAA